MGLFFLMLMFLVVSFLMGFVPILGPILLGFGVEIFNARLMQETRRRPETRDLQTFYTTRYTMLTNFLVALMGVILSWFYSRDVNNIKFASIQAGVFVVAYMASMLIRYVRHQDEIKSGLKWW